ncbi:2-oxoacid:acceptor oxidoreductase subunit alpha [bacterium]|nr:2-oxoacid:acceptor oxidoreductase subunit alpha [candidate division CSSED10-310 bacterium]
MIQAADDIVIKICGSAGDGSISAVEILNRAAALMGYHIMNFDAYPAEIRGFGKSVGHTRISRSVLLTTGKYTDCLVALDDVHAITELSTMSKRGVLIYDSKPPQYHQEDQAVAGFIEPGMIGYGIPLRELSTIAVRSSRSRNIVALGVLAALLHLQAEYFETAIRKRFSAKPETVIDNNINAFRLGFDYTLQNVNKYDELDFQHHVYSSNRDSIIMSGNEAAARACLDADLRLYAGYPITPATRIMEILAKELPLKGGFVVQTEDEISAAGHVVGAGFAGARSLTATSGPGICLMSEMINLAVMAEIPSVFIDSQRGGPSTGLPTKTEQSDFNIAAFGGSGDSPRPVLAPTSVPECYLLTRIAFDLAECYQTPVIILMDFFLSNRFEDIDLNQLNSNVFGRFTPQTAPLKDQPYLRFEVTDTGISPRAIPGMENMFHTVTGLEHDERGFPNYGKANHLKMTAKRHKKMETLVRDWQETGTFGPEGQLDVGFISWGSSVGAVMEAISLLNDQNIHSGGFFPRLLSPLQTSHLEVFSRRCKRIIVVEMNYTGQYANYLQVAISKRMERFTRVDAEPISSEDIVNWIIKDES